MARDLLKGGGKGRFYRGNLHCLSNGSDGLLGPEEVLNAYRGAGYDFVCLSDHFEEDFTLILGGGDRWQSGQERTGEPVVKAEFSLAPFRGAYCRVTVADAAGRRAWGNPIRP